MPSAPVNDQVRALIRGCDAVYTEAELAQRLAAAAAAGRPLRVKLGMDPTAPDIHLGHVVALRKLRQFQDLGHVAVLIIGDFTARIGDPSGRSKTRPVLTPEEVDRNAATYLAQAGKVLDTSPQRLEIRHNSEWLSKMDFAAVLRLAGSVTLQQLTKRDDFAQRLRDQTPIGLHELLYPLMQGCDSVNIRADVELGGTDQTFNNLVGRDLQAASGQPPQIVMTVPLLVGLDGRMKMSKSYGNYVGVAESAHDMFRKLMTVPDGLMPKYAELLCERPAEHAAREFGPDAPDPLAAKKRLARLVTAQFHDDAAAAAEARRFDEFLAGAARAADFPAAVVRRADCDPDGTWLPKLMKLAGLCKSTSEGRRLIEQGGVMLDDRPVTDPQTRVVPAGGMVLRVGKREPVRLELQ